MVAARLGRTFRPWLALALEATESSATKLYTWYDEHTEINQYGIGPLLHVCATPHVWLRGGIAVSRLVIYDRDGMSIQDTAAAVSVAAGVQVSRRVDLSLRWEVAHFDPAGRTFIPVHTWLVMGATWN